MGDDKFYWSEQSDPTSWGYDNGGRDGEPHMAVRRLDGAVFICEVPKVLGAVTGLRVKAGTVIADTESGTPMIVPSPKRT